MERQDTTTNQELLCRLLYLLPFGYVAFPLLTNKHENSLMKTLL